MLCCETLLLLLRWDTGRFRDRFGGMVRFKSGLRGKRRVNSEIMDVITEMNYSCNAMEFFFKYKYNEKTFMFMIKFTNLLLKSS